MNSRGLKKLPWNTVGVKILEGESEERTITISTNDVDAKTVICGDMISSFYPQWVITSENVTIQFYIGSTCDVFFKTSNF